MADLLTDVGFIVKRITRREGGDHIWELSLRAGTVVIGRTPSVVGRFIARAVTELGFKCKAKDVSVLVTAKLIQAYFIWKIPGSRSVSFYEPPHRRWKQPNSLKATRSGNVEQPRKDSQRTNQNIGRDDEWPDPRVYRRERWAMECQVAKNLLDDLAREPVPGGGRTEPRVFFFADADFDESRPDFNPLFRFGDVDLFIYAGSRGDTASLMVSLEALTSKTNFFAGGEVMSFNLDRDKSHFKALFKSWNDVQQPDWAAMYRVWRPGLSHKSEGSNREVWVLFIRDDPALVYDRLFNARDKAPHYLAFSTNPGETWVVPHHDWTSELALAVQSNEVAEPTLVITRDFGGIRRQYWPWVQPWQEFNGWGEFVGYALPKQQLVPVVTAQEAPSNRTIVIRRSLLRPEALKDEKLVIISPEMHHQQQWPPHIKLVVIAKPEYTPDARTLRLNPNFQTIDIKSVPMKQALEEVEKLCDLLAVSKVASAQFGFEDEGPALRKWRNSAGPARSIIFFLPLPGNVEAFGPFVDQIVE